MDTKQKFQVLKAITLDAAIKMDVNGKWYVSLHGVGIIERNSRSAGAGGHCDTVEDAITSAFDELTTVKPPRFVEIFRGGKNEYVRWNGFMWQHEDASER